MRSSSRPLSHSHLCLFRPRGLDRPHPPFSRERPRALFPKKGVAFPSFPSPSSLRPSHRLYTHTHTNTPPPLQDPEPSLHLRGPRVWVGARVGFPSPVTPTHPWPSPPYLGAELEVDHDDADLGTGDHQDDKYEEQEAKEVVELILPDGLKNQRKRNRHSKSWLSPSKPFVAWKWGYLRNHLPAPLPSPPNGTGLVIKQNVVSYRMPKQL